MDADVHTRAHEISKHAAGLPAPQRTGYLDEACGDEGVLRREVESILREFDDVGDFLEVSILERSPEAVERALSERAVGHRIGRYTIESVVASGGMGTVFLARQDHPERTVALKVLRGASLTPELMRRFEFEAALLARLSHPNIAHVYEAGVHEASGIVVPFIAMEYVADAHTLTAYADTRCLALRDRLMLFTIVCDAVSHGHQSGVIHRDLKPANVLVDPASGEPKIIDFGIARRVDEDAATRHTDAGQLLGTVQYMSPEQCGAAGAELDTRIDVYALGVILYELLTGILPYDLDGLAIDDAVRVIRERPPTRPSAANDALRGDVETIVLKALEKEPDRRYASAAELAQDVRRYLDERPIEARPATVLYQLRMFARRNRTVCTAAACVVTVLVAAVIVSVAFAWRADRARNDAEAERDAMVWRSYVGCIAGAELAHDQAQYHAMRTLLEKAPLEHRGWDWYYLARLAEPGLRTYDVSPCMVSAIALSGDGLLLACGGTKAEWEVVVWDMPARERHVLLGHTGTVRSVAFDTSARRLLSASNDGTVRLWLLDEPDASRLLVDLGYAVSMVSVLPGDERCVVTSHDRTIRVVRLNDGAELNAVRARSPITAAAVTADGTRLVTGGIDGVIEMWEVSTLERIGVDMTPAGARIQGIAFDADGERIAATTRESELLQWHAMTGDVTLLAAEWPRRLRGVTYDADQTHVVTVADHEIRIVGLGGGDVTTLRGHERPATAVVVDPGRRVLYSGSWDETVRVWDLATDVDPGVLRAHDGGVRAVEFSPDGSRLASGSIDETVVVWNAHTGARVETIRCDGPVTALTYSPDGNMLLSGRSGRIDVWSASAAKRLTPIDVPEGNLWSLACAPDGQSVYATVGRDVGRWDVQTGDALEPITTHAQRALTVDVTPDGSRVASGSRDGTIRLFDTIAGREIETAPNDSLDVFAVRFSPDGSRLVSGSRDRVIHCWSAVTGEHLYSTYDHGRSIVCIDFSPDGRRLAAGSWDGAIGIFDAATGELLTTLRGHDGTVWSLDFSTDGARIASASVDGTVRLWAAKSPR